MDKRTLPEYVRREIFHALVEAKAKVGEDQARKDIARRFDITAIELEQINAEGSASRWPPL